MCKSLLEECILSILFLYIIINFQYNAPPHWFKQHALSEYKEQNKSSRDHPEMAGKFPSFSIGIIRVRGVFSL